MSDARSYPQRPFLAVSAAIVRDGKILVVRRARAPAHGLFTLARRRGRDRRDARGSGGARGARGDRHGDRAGRARRLSRSHRARRATDRVERHFVILCFAARWRAGEPVLNEELSEARWLDPAELAGLPTTARPRRDRGGGIRSPDRRSDGGCPRRGAPSRAFFPSVGPRQCRDIAIGRSRIHVGADTPAMLRRLLDSGFDAGCDRACGGARARARRSRGRAVRRQPAAARRDPRRAALPAQHLRRQRRPEVAQRDAGHHRRRGAGRRAARAHDRQLQSRLSRLSSRPTAAARRRPIWSFAATSRKARRSPAR